MPDSSTFEGRPDRGGSPVGLSSLSLFFRGFLDPWRGLRFLIEHPRLWLPAAIPFVICLVLYVGLIALGWNFVHGWLEGALLERGVGWRILGYLLEALFWIAIFFVAAIAFVPLAALVASPFNDLLSEKTEKLYRRVEIDEPFSMKLLLRSLRVGLIGELKRALYLGALLIFAFALGFIPMIGGPLSAFLSTYFTISFLSLEFTSYSMDRRLYTWQRKREFIGRNKPRTLGFGAMALLIMLVPIVNAFFIPVSAVGGTLLFCDTEPAES